MQNYRDSNNKVHFLDDVRYEHLLPRDCVKITQDEADILINSPLPNPQKSQLLKDQIVAIEQKQIMPRGAREAFIALCEEQGVKAGLNKTQLYAANPFYRGLKDTDAEAITIRAQIKALV